MTFLLSLFRRAHNDSLRGSISTDQRLRPSERMMWVGLVVRGRSKRGRFLDRTVSEVFEGPPVRPTRFRFRRCAIKATEADPLTITELFPFRRFPFWLPHHPESCERQLLILASTQSDLETHLRYFRMI
jgi:hypothetical protein